MTDGVIQSRVVAAMLCEKMLNTRGVNVDRIIYGDPKPVTNEILPTLIDKVYSSLGPVEGNRIKVESIIYKHINEP